MIRRDFFKIAAAGAIAATPTGGLAMATDSSASPVLPPLLKRGDTVALVAPGTNVTDPDDLKKAYEAMEYFGLKPKIYRPSEEFGYKSRSVRTRTNEIHSAFSDKEVRGVVCLRGGYASAMLLDSLDYNLIRNNPKVFVGYSDITAMHCAINKFSGLVTYHGPVALSAFTKYTINSFEEALFRGARPLKLSNPAPGDSLRQQHPTRTISPGVARGRIVGGNLSIICSLMGTPYEIDTKGKILIIEDVGEEPYRMDRMLNQLRLAGKLADAAGIAVGECADCNSNGLNPSKVWDPSLGEVLDNYLAGLSKPVFYGLTFGHTSDQLTIPIGAEAEIDAGGHCITLL